MRNPLEDRGGATLSVMLETAAARWPVATAILGVGHPGVSYDALYKQVFSTASALRENGIGRQDRVAIVLPNGPQLASAFLAASTCAVSAPLNPAYTEEEFEFYLSDLGAKALLVEPGGASAASAVARRLGVPILELPLTASSANGSIGLTASDDLALVLHTSGTTSRPKIVPLTHANLIASAKHVAESLALTPADRCLNVMPLFHVHGLVAALLASLWSGGSVIATPGFRALQFSEWMNEYRPSWYTAVPTMHHSILMQAEREPQHFQQHRLRFIRSCSAPLAPQLMTRLERVFQAPVIEAYGMTEAAHQMTSNPLPPRRRKPGSVGVLAGPEVAVMDSEGNFVAAGQIGEVVIRGPNVTRGYENNPLANASSFTRGWFRTGDQGVLDHEGYLTLTGRLKEIINRGGEKIQPREIDEALLDHPAVAQAVTFAIPDQRLGEDVGVAIVLRPGLTATAEEIRRFAAARLADFKVPGRVVFIDEIPKGPTGKPQRIGLADKLGLRDAGETRESAPYQPPASDLEKQLAAIWADVLKTSRVGRRDDFFQLGGDSMTATLVASRIQDRLGISVTTASVLVEAPTIEQLAALIEARGHSPRWVSLVPLQREGTRPPLYCMHGNEGNVLFYRELADHLSKDQPVYGLQSPLLLEADGHGRSLQQLAALYAEEIRSFQRRGPYHLAGFCMGAYLAFEVACLFQREGEDVGLLAVINTPGSWKLPESFVASVRYHTAHLVKLSLVDGTRYIMDRARYRSARGADLVATVLARWYRSAGMSTPVWIRRRLITSAHIRASVGYWPGVFRGPLKYFQGSGETWRDFRPFWSRAVDGPIDCAIVPGKGIEVLREPNVRSLASKIGDCLDEAQSTALRSGGK